MTCPHCVGAADFFDEKTARRELKRLRKRGPPRTTGHLLDALGEEVPGASILDVGGGVGALQLGLLEAGAARVLNVDASPAYQAAAREEARRRGLEDRLDFLAGDVVELAAGIEVHDVVTLDRVLCCYPDLDGLVEVTADRARRLWAAVFPREHLGVRLGIRLLNLFQRLRGHPFRIYLHGTERIEGAVRARGFHERGRKSSFLWDVRIFERTTASDGLTEFGEEGTEPSERGDGA